jgi:hypothetical protein
MKYNESSTTQTARQKKHDEFQHNESSNMNVARLKQNGLAQAT